MRCFVRKKNLKFFWIFFPARKAQDVRREEVWGRSIEERFISFRKNDGIQSFGMATGTDTQHRHTKLYSNTQPSLSAFGLRHSAFGIGELRRLLLPSVQKQLISSCFNLEYHFTRPERSYRAERKSVFDGGGGGRGRAEEGRRATILGFLECFLKKRGHRSIYRYIIAKQLFIYPTVSASLLLIVRVPRLYLYTYTQLGWRI